MQVDLTDREVAQLLAALRNWQTDSLNEDLGEAFAGHFEVHGPMNDIEIEVLCRKLNFGRFRLLKGAAY